jgi:hypothetical protein
MNKIANKLFLLLIILALFLPFVGKASGWEAGFDPNNIMSDSYMGNKNTLDVAGIQRFLDSLPGRLKNYRARDINGRECSAAEIFYNSAQSFGINPQILVALVEKEQRLLTNPNPTQKALDWATGFGSYGHPRYGGFGAQVYYAAKVLAPGGDYDKYPDYYKSFGVGRATTTLDGYKVTPANRATAKLYIYNPLVGHPQARFGANWLLWHLINVRYANSLRNTNGSVAGAATTKPQDYFYRSGTAVRTEGVIGVSIIKDGKRYGVEGRNALLARYKSSEVINIPRAEFDSFSYAGKIGLADGMAVQRQKGGAVYIVSDEVLRGVPDMETFRKLGYSPANIIKISDAEANFHKIGKPVDPKNLSRLNGQLVQVAGEQGVYLFQNKKLYPLWSREIKDTNFPHVPIAIISKTELANYKRMDQEPVPIRDGSLLMTTEGPQAGVVFVVANGKRCGFKSREAFVQAGYNFANITRVSRKVLEMHSPGKDIETY